MNKSLPPRPPTPSDTMPTPVSLPPRPQFTGCAEKTKTSVRVHMIVSEPELDDAAKRP